MPLTTPSSAESTTARLLSLASHELRTPTSVVAGYLRMILRDPETQLGARQQKMVEEAEKSCGRIAALAAELSELAKLESGTAAFDDTEFDLFPLLEEVAEAVREPMDREVTVRVDGESSGARMKGDRLRTRTAFTAFLAAVVREQPAGGRVTVRRTVGPSSTRPGEIVIGGESHLEQASSADGPFNEHRGGQGLALPIARRVIERHGGRVRSPHATAESGAAAGAIIVTLPLLESRR